MATRRFRGYRPGPRYGTDATPFTLARIEEAALSAGPWTAIDTLKLDPVDTDPANPQTRDLSTDNATLDTGWYRVVFIDQDGDEEYTDPVPYPPTAAVYFTTSELREQFPDPLADDTKYPDVKIEQAREYVETRIENICGVAFVPRTATTTLDVPAFGDRALVLKPRLRAITAISVDGTAWTSSEIDGLNVASSGVLYRGSRDVWSGLVEITYEHGFDEPSVDVKDAAMLWTRERVVKGPVTDRATQIPTEAGGSINLATPGLFGSHSGLPEVDAVLADNMFRTFVA